MNFPGKELFALYEEMVSLHIGTKTNDLVFHQASAGFYDTLFAAFHDTAEAMQDGKMSQPTNPAEAKSKAYAILMKAKEMLSSMVESNSDIALDNKLRGLVDKLTFDCGTARGFTDSKDEAKEVSEEDGSEQDTPEDEEESDDVSSYGIEIEPEEEEMMEDEVEDEDGVEDEEKDNKNLR